MQLNLINLRDLILIKLFLLKKEEWHATFNILKLKTMILNKDDVYLKKLENSNLTNLNLKSL